MKNKSLFYQIARIRNEKSDRLLGEVKLMYDNLLEAGVGGFANYDYWSSTEFDSGIAWYQNFLYDYQDFNSGKYYSIRVRAVRAF